MMSSVIPDRIQWHEGLLLSPQHFQQESTRVDEQMAWLHLAGAPLGWGVRRLKIDENLLATGLLRVLHLDAVLPDGMPITWSVEHARGLDLSLDLTAHATTLEQRELPVYLILGRSRSMAHPGQPSRFRGVAASPVEDEVSQALPVDIPRATANLALAVGEVPSSVFLHMKLMTVHKDNEVVRVGGYLPALLDVPRESDLFRGAQALAAQMRSKAVFLAKQTAQPSSRMEDRLSLLEHRGRLASLTTGLPILEALLRSPAVAPFQLYLALCAQLGPLAMLRPGAVPLLPPAWDPEDPISALGPVLQALQESVAEVSQEWRTQLFGFDGTVFSIDMQAQWLGQRIVIGLRGQAERELIAWMEGAAIGSRTVFTSLSDRRVLGPSRNKIDEARELGVRSSSGYTLFAINVMESFIVPDQPLLVGNLNESSESRRPQEMVLFIKGS